LRSINVLWGKEYGIISIEDYQLYRICNPELEQWVGNLKRNAIQMKLWQTLLPIFLLMILPIVGACATESQKQPTPTPAIDVPYLSFQDAISIAQEHSITSPLNLQEKQAGLYARMGGTKGWIADYTGNGKWIVELLVRNEDESLTVYRWTVVEVNLTALFVGAYEGSLIRYKSKYGHYP